MPKVSPTSGFGPSGRRLWAAATGLFEFEWAPETEVLRELCRVLDRLDALNARVAADGLTVESSQGIKIHPCLAEARLQQQVMVKLADSLKLKVSVETPNDGSAPRLKVVAK
jgi:hypothetical protein